MSRRKTTINEIVTELKISLEKLEQIYSKRCWDRNCLQTVRKEFFIFGELELDEILKKYNLKRYQLDGKLLNHLRMIITMRMIEIN